MSSTDLRVAISVSSPDEPELAARGLIEAHVRHSFVEVARQILAAGGSLAYGGDLRAGGYTRTLLALLRTYSRADRPESTRIRQYLAAPLWKNLTPRDEAELAVLDRVLVSARDRYHGPAGFADELTAMRELMTEETDARIVIGGRVAGQKGRWPGIVEEAYLALRARQPLYVVGGLGGAADRIAQALRGTWCDELTEAHQLEHAEDTEAYQQILRAGLEPDAQALRAALTSELPNNGLDSDENALLMASTDLDLIVALLLRGLRALSGASG